MDLIRTTAEKSSNFEVFIIIKFEVFYDLVVSFLFR